MQSQRYSLGVAGILAACLFSLSASANSTGKTGFSGKQGPNCMQSGCHATNPSSAIPTVTISGPTTLPAGSSGNYTLIITGGPAVKAGMNVAVSDNGGTLGKSGSELQVLGGELTHTAPKPFSNGEVRFDFSLLAPTTSRTITLYASGNSVNDDKNFTQDHATSTTLQVQITGGSNPDAGSPDSGTTDPGDNNNDNDNDNSGDKGGCSTTGGVPMAMLLGLVVAARLRRRSA